MWNIRIQLLQASISQIPQILQQILGMRKVFKLISWHFPVHEMSTDCLSDWLTVRLLTWLIKFAMRLYIESNFISIKSVKFRRQKNKFHIILPAMRYIVPFKFRFNSKKPVKCVMFQWEYVTQGTRANNPVYLLVLVKCHTTSSSMTITLLDSFSVALANCGRGLFQGIILAFSKGKESNKKDRNQTRIWKGWNS